MSNPTQDQNDQPRWWLELDDGELLAVDDKPVTTIRSGEGRESVLVRLPAWRAHDLSRVLSVYTRMMTLFDEASHVSGSEDRLSGALADASLAARGEARTEADRSGPSKVTSAARLRAMAVLQARRPWLTHTALIGVVDAAARWLDGQEDDLARGLLVAAGGEETGAHAWLILLNLDRPPAASGDEGQADAERSAGSGGTTDDET